MYFLRARGVEFIPGYVIMSLLDEETRWTVCIQLHIALPYAYVYIAAYLRMIFYQTTYFFNRCVIYDTSDNVFLISPRKSSMLIDRVKHLLSNRNEYSHREIDSFLKSIKHS